SQRHLWNEKEDDGCYLPTPTVASAFGREATPCHACFVRHEQRRPSASIDEAQAHAGAPFEAARRDAFASAGRRETRRASCRRRDRQPEAVTRADGYAAVEGVDDVRRLRPHPRRRLDARPALGERLAAPGVGEPLPE